MKRTLTVCAVLACSVLLPALAQAADTKPANKPVAAPAVPDEKAMQAAFEKMAAVGPNHTLLQGAVGEWDAAVKMWMAPGAPPMESAGEIPDPMAPATRLKVRQVIRFTDDDHHTMEWHQTHAGKEAKSMEISYTRKK